MHVDNPIPHDFQTIIDTVGMVASGSYICCAASGRPGIGKSRIVERKLAAMRVPYVMLNGQATIAGIVHLAYQWRRGGVIVLDDVDNVITGGGTNGANIMKSLLDPRRERRSVSITTAAALSGKTLYPPHFETMVRFVWLTNADLSDPALLTYPPQSRPHIQALLSRGLEPIVINSEAHWVLDYINDLIVNHDLLRRNVQRPLSMQQAIDLREWFINKADLLPQLSVRVLVDRLAPLVHAYPTRWKSLAEHGLPTAPVRSIKPIELEGFHVRSKHVAMIGTQHTEVVMLGST